MKPPFFFLFLFLCLAFSSQAGSGIIHLTDSNYAVIPYTKSEFAPFKNAKAATLTKEEIQEIETLMNKSIDEYNKEVYSRPRKHNAINDIGYKVQVVPVINEKGEKEVWVNCFCPSSHSNQTDWRKNIAGWDNGGGCCFELKINLSTQKYYHLYVRMGPM